MKFLIAVKPPPALYGLAEDFPAPPRPTPTPARFRVIGFLLITAESLISFNI
jgi:hypothetical protein